VLIVGDVNSTIAVSLEAKLRNLCYFEDNRD
jgi:hypothetical protein